ncbi:hypothetical protein KOW79_009024 [Hemibagrus wyckioides]|uniref:Uncharacterized protein n=1 Tax=Hemibagrus wyckioides TaxID=337641 RepID=A0A9D3NUB7_9TELE|nr:hypothetical protein KOW79_009024 [Hemibagrus wyckioides]
MRRRRRRSERKRGSERNTDCPVTRSSIAVTLTFSPSVLMEMELFLQKVGTCPEESGNERWSNSTLPFLSVLATPVSIISYMEVDLSSW